MLFAIFMVAQDGKKSSVTKTIDGKKYYIHTVEKNQSLYAIAKIYNIDLNSMLAENPDAIDGLKVGDELRIPFKTETAPTVTSPSDLDKYVLHKVEKKETVYGISKKYSIALFKVNSTFCFLTMNTILSYEFEIITACTDSISSVIIFSQYLINSENTI